MFYDISQYSHKWNRQYHQTQCDPSIKNTQQHTDHKMVKPTREQPVVILSDDSFLVVIPRSEHGNRKYTQADEAEHVIGIEERQEVDNKTNDLHAIISVQTNLKTGSCMQKVESHLHAPVRTIPIDEL